MPIRVQRLAAFDLPELEPYRTLRRRKDLERRRLFVVEGDKVVLRLLESPFPLVSLLLTEEWLQRVESRLQQRPESIDVFVATKPEIERITGFSSYQGIKAVARIAEPATLEGVLQASARPRLFVALDGLSNAENLGVVVRNSAALGVQALIVGETSGSPFLTRAIRTSMGTLFRLPAVEVTSLVAALATLRADGVRCFAAHPRPDGRSIAQADFTGDCCVVFGSEGEGIADEVLAACDDAVAIPMASGVDSLNVGSAAAVFLYEVQRQRTMA
jgi:tRNA G18 (ribose-2'-O)-methylase SpoU